MAVEVDVATPEGVEHLFARAVDVFGPVDILVNNAGASYGTDLRTIEPDVWDRNFNVVLKSAFLCTKAALPAMIDKNKGAIINIASVNGMMGLGEEAYSAAKAGMINLTQNTAIRYGPHQVRANCIAPGTVDTPIWGERKKANPNVMRRTGGLVPARSSRSTRGHRQRRAVSRLRRRLLDHRRAAAGRRRPHRRALRHGAGADAGITRNVAARRKYGPRSQGGEGTVLVPSRLVRRRASPGASADQGRCGPKDRRDLRNGPSPCRPPASIANYETGSPPST